MGSCWRPGIVNGKSSCWWDFGFNSTRSFHQIHQTKRASKCLQAPMVIGGTINTWGNQHVKSYLIAVQINGVQNGHADDSAQWTMLWSPRCLSWQYTMACRLLTLGAALRSRPISVIFVRMHVLAFVAFVFSLEPCIHENLIKGQWWASKPLNEAH